MTEFGMAGGYTDAQLRDLAQRKITPLLLEAEWKRAEPNEGRFDYLYLDTLRATKNLWMSYGHKVVLNYGLHHAPDWFLAKPSARHVASDGELANDDAPDFITHSSLRFYGERYTSVFFSTVGSDWRMVRIGGGHWGELTYPGERTPAGAWRWWGYAPKSTNPVKSWKPGQQSPNGQATKYLNWYLTRLADYGLWQAQIVRRQFAGTIALLLPSWGMRPGDFEKAVATNLNGSSSAERNGEVQRGYDHARAAAKMAVGANVALWGTWANRAGTLSWLASLAGPRKLRLAGENAAGASLDGMTTAARESRRLGSELLLAIRAADAYGSGQWSIDDYQRLAS